MMKYLVRILRAVPEGIWISIAVIVPSLLGAMNVIVFAMREPPPQRIVAAAPEELSNQGDTAEQSAGPSPFELEDAMTFSERMKRWDPLVEKAAKRFNVPKTWVRAVIQVESGGRTMLAEDEPIVSSMGAMGLMQLMPETYDEMRSIYRLGNDPFDPQDNIMAGTAYLKWLHGKYGYPAMFAAYNDGPGNLEARMVSGGLLPQETRDYSVRIAKALGKKNLQARFTRPNGETIYIDAAAATAVRAPFPGEYAPGVRAVIVLGRRGQGVAESLPLARAIVRSYGGRT
ncbi:MAG: transglycosylase SLT domain-containing protein [Alphaproteobacteria bacterium]|nr:transglycosylase SLT domain-containing protein [Alphaproteobacteria bacterium]